MSGFFKLKSKKRIIPLFVIFLLVFQIVFSSPVLAGGSGALGGGVGEEIEEGELILEGMEETEEKGSRWWVFGLAGLAGLGLGFYVFRRRRF